MVCPKSKLDEECFGGRCGNYSSLKYKIAFFLGIRCQFSFAHSFALFLLKPFIGSVDDSASGSCYAVKINYTGCR